MKKPIVLIIFILISMGFTFAQQRAELVIQSGHSSLITCMEYSKDSRWIVSGGSDKRIVVWDAHSGRQFRIITGFKNNIVTVSIDNAGKYLFASDDYNANVYQIDNGKMLFHYGQQYWGAWGCVHPTKQIIALYRDYNIEIIDFEKNVTLTKFHNPISNIKCIRFSPDGKWFAIGGTSGSMVLMDVEDNYKVKFESKGGEVNQDVISIDFTSDSKYFAYLATGSFDPGNIYFVKTGSKKEFAKIKTTSDAPKQISISPDNKFLAVGSTRKFSVYDVQTAKMLQDFETDDYALGNCWSPDGKFLALARMQNANLNLPGIIEMRDATDLKKKLFKLDSYTKMNEAIAFSPTQDLAVFGYWTGVLHSFDLKTGSHKGMELHQGNWSIFSSLNFSPDGKMIGCGVSSGNAAVLETSTMKVLKEFEHEDSRMSSLIFSKDNLTLYGCGGYAFDYSYYRQWNIKDFAMQAHHDSLFKMEARTMSISPDEQKVAVIGMNGEFLLYNAKTGALIQKSKEDLGNQGTWRRSIAYSPDGTLLLANTNPNYIYFYNPNTLEKLNGSIKIHLAFDIKFSPSKEYVAVCGGDSTDRPIINVYDATNFKLQYSIKDHTDRVTALSWSRDSKFIISSSWDGTSRFWNAASGNEVASFIGAGPNDFVLVTPDNYYMASKGGMKGVGYRVNDKILPFDQFDLRFNRPDIVLSRFGYASQQTIAAYKRAWQKRVANLGFSTEQLSNDFHIPELKIASQNIPSTTQESSLKFFVKATDSKYKLNKIMVYDNDVAVFGKKGIELTSQNISEILQPLNIYLENGKNKIVISVFNEHGAESIREVLEVFCTKTVEKPNLFIVAIGVSKFKMSDYNLTFAAKDANDIVNFFKQNNSKYNNVKTLIFSDEQATRSNILKAKEFLSQSKTNDQVLVFVASHGLLDDKLDYYIATHDIDFFNPSQNGLAYSDLDNLLDNIPARRKIMLLDACNSGEVDKEENVLADAVTNNTGQVKSRGFKTVKEISIGTTGSFELMKEIFADIRKGTGAVVISSASGREFAFESSEWQNGVFTFSVLEGLRTQKADANSDNKITVSEIQNYVVKRVSELTNGQQNPTSRTENLENDFEIW